MEHLLCLETLDREALLNILEDARKMKVARQAGAVIPWLVGRTLALVFEKPSTRTRVSFEVAMFELGGNTVYVSRESSQLSRGEPPGDTAKVLSGYVHGMVVRTFQHKIIAEMAAASRVPVINGLTDLRHPCQVLSDLMTIQERRGSLEGLSAAWIGDGNNMANSWIAAAQVLGFELRLACPEGYDPDPGVVEQARAAGATIVVTRDPAEAVAGVDAVNTDVWASMGQEEEQDERMRIFMPYQVNGALMQGAADDALVLHCLPAHRGEEITSEVLDGESSVVIDQAGNRLHVAKAVLKHFLRDSIPN